MLRPTQHQWRSSCHILCFQEPPVDVTSYTAPVKKFMTHSMFPGVAGRCYVLHSTSGEAHDTFYVSRSHR